MTQNHYDFMMVAAQNPDTVIWGPPFTVEVQRIDSKLGFSIKTQSCGTSDETFTVVTKVQSTHGMTGGPLLIGDRVIECNSINITHYLQDHVVDVLRRSGETLKCKASHPHGLYTDDPNSVDIGNTSIGLCHHKDLQHMEYTGERVPNDFRREMSKVSQQPMFEGAYAWGPTDPCNDKTSTPSSSNNQNSAVACHAPTETKNLYKHDLPLASGSLGYSNKPNPASVIKIEKQVRHPLPPSSRPQGSSRDLKTSTTAFQDTNHSVLKVSSGPPHSSKQYHDKSATGHKNHTPQEVPQILHNPETERHQSVNFGGHHSIPGSGSLERCGQWPPEGVVQETVARQQVGDSSNQQQLQQIVLKNPSLICWELPVITVRLRTDASGKLGFKFKFKMCRSELFCLVEKITGSPAQDHLHVGDWIRSINGAPLQTMEKVKEIVKDMKSQAEKEITVVLQRPRCVIPGKASLRANTEDTRYDSVESIYPSFGENSLDPLLPTGNPEIPSGQADCAGMHVNTSSSNEQLEGSLPCSFGTPPRVSGLQRNRSDSSTFTAARDRQQRKHANLRKIVSDTSKGSHQSPLANNTSHCASCRCKGEIWNQSIDHLGKIKEAFTLTSVEPMDYIPVMQVVLLGYSTDQVVKLLCGNTQLHPTEQNKLANVYHCELVRESCGGARFVSTAEDFADHFIARAVANELSTNPDFSLIVTAAQEMKERNNEIENVPIKTLAHYLSHPVPLKKIVGVKFLAVQDSPIAKYSQNILFTKHSIFTLVLDLTKLGHSNIDMDWHDVCDYVSNIRLYAGHQAPIVIILFGHTSPHAEKVLTDFIRFYLSEFVIHQIVFSSTTQQPYFRVNSEGENGEDLKLLEGCLAELLWQQSLSCSICSTSNESSHHSNSYPMMGAVLQRRLTKMKKSKIKCWTLLRLREELIEITDQEIGEEQLHQTLAYLHHSGIILYRGAHSASTTKKSVLDMFILVEPLCLVDYLERITDVPNTHSDELNIKDRTWNRLLHNGILPYYFVTMEILKDHSENREILAFLELYHMAYVFRSPLGGATGYSPGGGIESEKTILVPYCLPVQNNISDASYVDLLLVDFNGYLPSSLFLHFMVVMSSLSDNSAIQCLTAGQFSVQGHTFKVTFDIMSAQGAILLRQRPVNCYHFLSFLKSVLHEAFINLPQGHLEFHLGPPCPLGDLCINKKGYGGAHVINVDPPNTPTCGHVSLDNYDIIRQWRDGGALHTTGNMPVGNL